MKCPTVLAAFAAALATSTLASAGSYPMIMGIKPVAIQVGTSAELVVQSRYSMDDSYRVMISGSGVTGEIIEAHSKPVVRTNGKRPLPKRRSARPGSRRSLSGSTPPATRSPEFATCVWPALTE